MIKIEDIEVGDKVQLKDGNIYCVNYIDTEDNMLGVKLPTASPLWISINDVISLIKKGTPEHPHKNVMIAAAHGAEVEWNDLDKWQLISDPSYLKYWNYRVKPLITKSPNQIKKESIQKQMEELAKELEELNVE